MSRDRSATDRLGPGEVDTLARLALELAEALDMSIPDLAHRAHVEGILRGAAPTFSAALDRLLTQARRTRARIARQPVHHRPGSA